MKYFLKYDEGVTEVTKTAIDIARNSHNQKRKQGFSIDPRL